MNVFIKNGGGGNLDPITATNDKVLSGYTYNDSEGEIQTGTMKNKGSIDMTIGVNEGYSNTNGYYSSIKFTGPTLIGDATSSDVINGKTFYSNDGDIKTGTMNNNGSITVNIGIDGSESFNEGYYSSIKVTGPSLTGNATPSMVRSGYTFYSSNGTKQTGTLPTRTLSTTTVPNEGVITGSAGYYDSFTIKSLYAVEQRTFPMTSRWTNSKLRTVEYWGASASNPATSFKLTASGGCIWFTRNAGSDCNIYITGAYTY